MSRWWTSGLCVLSAAAGVAVARWVPAAPPPERARWQDVAAELRGSAAETADLRGRALAVLATSDAPSALAVAAELLGIAGRPGDEELLDALLAAHEPELDTPALRALGRLGTDEAVAVLVARLDDPELSAWEVTAALGRTGHPAAQQRLQELAADPSRGSGAVAALGALGTPAALAAIWDELDRGRASMPDAARALARRARIDPEVEGRIEQRLRGPRTVQRAALVDALAQQRDPLVLDALLDDLRTKPAPLAARAATSLGSLRDPRAIGALRHAADEGANEVRYASLGALAAIGSPAAVDALLDLAESSPASRSAAAVGAIVDPSAPEVLPRLVALAEGGATEVRVAAQGRLLNWTWGAGEVPDEVLSLARRLLGAPGSPMVDPTPLLLLHGTPEDWAALEAIVDQRGPRRQMLASSLSNVYAPEATRLLIRLGEDPDPSVRQTAMWALLDRGEVSLTEGMLLEQLEGGTNDYGMTENLLVRIGSERAIDAVLARVETGTSREWYGAVAAIAGNGTRDQVERLAALADRTDDDELRTQILSSLVYSDGTDLDALAKRCEGSGDPRLEQVATQALARLGTPEAADRLLELTGADAAETRAGALNALTSIGGPAAEVALIEALHDSDVGWAAAGGLRQLGTPAATAALEDAARGVGVEPQVRAQVLASLPWGEVPNGTEILEQALRDAEPTIRATAVGSLESLGSTEAAHTLAAYVASDAPVEERRQAASALERLGGEVAADHEAQIRALLPHDTGR
ncbi:MAG: HEAT repeat domain-containing protein [Myxococcota bacterium]